MSNWKKWLHGLLGAVISSAATTVGAAGGASMAGTPLEIKQLGGAAVGGAITGAVLYLRQSPIPAESETITTTVTETAKVEKKADN